MTTNRVDAGPQTTHWGFLDASLPPVLTIESGEEVVISTVSGGPDALPPAGFQVPQALLDIHRAEANPGPAHICTGPVAIRGARPGQVLQVDILDIRLHYDWGYTAVRPLRGALPDDIDERQIRHHALDAGSMTARLAWGMDLPLRPFFGVMTVAPPPKWGRVSTIPPRRHGGNMDNKELTAGATLYLPIFNDEALFSVGDGHAAQGDGEVCVNAIETGLIGRFRLTVRDDFRLEWPLAETDGHLITMGFDPDLDTCAVIALRQMIAEIERRAGLSFVDAYMLCSLAADMRVTQVVNENKGVHLVMPKQHLRSASAAAA